MLEVFAAMKLREPLLPLKGKRVELGKALPWKTKDMNRRSSMATKLLEGMCSYHASRSYMAK